VCIRFFCEGGILSLTGVSRHKPAPDKRGGLLQKIKEKEMMKIRNVLMGVMLVLAANTAFSQAVAPGMRMGNGTRVEDCPAFESESEFFASVDNLRKTFYEKGWISFTERPGWQMMVMGGRKFWQNSRAVWQAGYR
jgi:hypothetical protein